MKHYTANYLLAPNHLITVNLIGLGGTGSNVLQLLARMNEGLMSLGHPGLHVYCWDGDIVSNANVGRQLFSPADIGANKATCLVSRINRFHGYGWEAIPTEYNELTYKPANITISCIDSAPGRMLLSELITGKLNGRHEPHKDAYYWMDYGNDKKTGQVVLGTVGRIKQPKGGVSTLPTVAKLFGRQLRQIKDDSSPSCSLAEAINKQDLFINSTLANIGMALLWKLFREGVITQSGAYLNLETMIVNPIKIRP